MKLSTGTTDYDVIVIGGGPAGMMAAGGAAKRGARVLLLEKNSDVGKKLLITGGGRCNVTNAELNTRTLLAHYKESSDFLYSAFAQYGVADTLDFFHTEGMPTKVEDNNRVFPASNTAHSVWQVMREYCTKSGVAIEANATVKDFFTEAGRISGLTLTNGTTLRANSYVVATGGKSRPETGSTGDGFRWLSALGHTVHEPDASLVPVALYNSWISRVAGVTLPTIKINIFQDGKKQHSERGKILFTHVGVSGPTILNMSKLIGELLEYAPVSLTIDLFPDIDEGTLDAELVSLFQVNNKQFKNTLSPLLPSALATILVELSGIAPEVQCNSITREERKRLGVLLKALPLSVKNLLGVDKAIVTSGGVSLSEIDFKTMRSRLHDNLYIIGDLLHIDRPSGGYSLQLCWTTGYVAGNAVPLALTPEVT